MSVNFIKTWKGAFSWKCKFLEILRNSNEYNFIYIYFYKVQKFASKKFQGQKNKITSSCLLKINFKLKKS